MAKQSRTSATGCGTATRRVDADLDLVHREQRIWITRGRRSWKSKTNLTICAPETRITKKFAALKAEGRAALVTFVTAGDPDLETSRAILMGLPKAGADVIELGMPFSDPMADGPAIQQSSLRALKSGQTMVKRCSWCVISAPRMPTPPSC